MPFIRLHPRTYAGRTKLYVGRRSDGAARCRGFGGATWTLLDRAMQLYATRNYLVRRAYLGVDMYTGLNPSTQGVPG